MQGSASILQCSNANMPVILLDSIVEDEILMLESSQAEVTDEIIAESEEVLDSKNIKESPLGQLEFNLETSEKNYAFVDLYMESGGVEINELMKTNYLNKPYLFNSQYINYKDYENIDFDAWLKSLSYGIYNYNSNVEVNTIDRSEENELINFSNSLVEELDGSAYLIDIDGNSTIDVISMLVIDQGFFDTDQSLFKIGDPLIPVQTEDVVDDFSEEIEDSDQSDPIDDSSEDIEDSDHSDTLVEDEVINFQNGTIDNKSESNLNNLENSEN